uniref:Uncharacterized protein n=1 Tax=Anguilla anguilla TaxID=7936 RepID=A0A0E9VPX9_ANGAN
MHECVCVCVSECLLPLY